jgi:serine/threonine protein kinase
MQGSSETTIESEKCWEAVSSLSFRILTYLLWSVGLGAFGEVRMCVHRDTGAQRAVKVLRKSHMDEDEKKMLFNEINILRNLVSSARALNTTTSLGVGAGPTSLFLFKYYLLTLGEDGRIFAAAHFCEIFVFSHFEL